MSRGILRHTHYEELSALASVGQISPLQYRELSDHMRGCPDCRDAYKDLFDLTHTQLPFAAGGKPLTANPAGLLARAMGKDYKARFVTRAREEGLNIAGAQDEGRGFWANLPRLPYQPAAAMAIVALLIVAGLLSHRWKEADARNAVMSTKVAQVLGQNAALQAQVESLSQGKQTIETDLLKTRNSSSDMVARLHEVEEQIKKNQVTIEAANAQLAMANYQGTETEQKLMEAQQTLLSADQEIVKLRASPPRDDARLREQQLQIVDLSHRTKQQEEIIAKQQKLLAVDADVRNLMAARNLHITDVFDVDGKGKKKSAFGRVFYTEGKSLIFYAFDLEGAKVATDKHSFQAWGQLSDSSTHAVNLGIFFVDDPGQKRWMLRFDNPEILEKINAVFVTTEPRGGAAHPSGQKLMYAYLGHEPNHP
jgi:hypothetical protein